MRKNGPLVVGALLFLVAGWIFAPMGIVHWVVFDLLWLGLPYYLPLLLVLAISFLVYMYQESLASLLLVIGTIGVIGWWFYLPGLSQYNLLQTFDAEYIEDIPSSTNVRFMPMSVALQLASSKYQDPRHHVVDLDPIELESGDIGWIGGRIPTGLVNIFTGQTQGTITVTPDGRVTTQDQTFACGEGMAITDNIRWKLWRTHYAAVLDEYYYITIDEEIVLIAPYLTYRLDDLVFVPQWGGVFIVDGDCHIEDLTPSEALSDGRLVGQRIVPEAYAKRVATAWQYQNGIMNKWFYHVDQTEVPMIDGENNQMPYLIPTNLGEQWFVAMEPYGPAYSIYKMIFVDAHDGTVRVFEYPADSAIISPNKAAGFIRAANPTYDWSSVIVIEPRPMIVDNILYWMLSQTSNDFSGVQRTILVRSTDEKVMTIESYEDLIAFVSGETMTAEEITAAQDAIGADVPDDLSSLTTSELYDLLIKVAEEIERR